MTLSPLQPDSSYWSSFESVKTPQLKPPAVCAADGSVLVGVEIQRATVINEGRWAIALLGTNLTELGATLVVTDTNDDPVGYRLLRLAAPGSPSHLVVLLDGTGFGNYRVRWVNGTGTAATLGCVHIGEVLEDISLADAGWSMRYVDSPQRLDSEDGQMYTGLVTRTRRQLRIRQATVEETLSLGSVAHDALITLSAPAITGFNAHLGSAPAPDLIEVNSAGNANINFEWSDVLAAGTYRLDYQYRANKPDMAANVSNPPAPGQPANLSTHGTVFFLLDGKTPFSIQVQHVVSGADSKTQVRLEALSRVGDEDLLIRIGPEHSLTRLYGEAGRSRPIIVMPNPSDPERNRLLGIYGLLASDPSIDDVPGGPYNGSAIVVDEAR